MKVVFLDFDGVLNSAAFLLIVKERDSQSLSMEWWAESIDPSAVSRLNGLLASTGARVVVSSTWRICTSVAWLQEVLEMRGFTGDVYDKTNRIYEVDRSSEIEEWLDRHVVDAYVILDDDSDAEIEGHFVRTDYLAGLTDGDVREAEAILGKL